MMYMEFIDRPRGILSKADRQYLLNPDGYSKQGRYERRQAIIERVHQALHDLPLLASRLDEKSRAEAFAGGEGEYRADPINDLYAAFAFLYLGITDIVEPKDRAPSEFEELVASGVKHAYLQRGYSVENVEVNLTVDRGDPLDELEERDELGLIEILQLVESGRVSGEESRELLNELLQERGDETIDETYQGEAAKFYVDVLDAIFEGMEEETEE